MNQVIHVSHRHAAHSRDATNMLAATRAHAYQITLDHRRIAIQSVP